MPSPRVTILDSCPVTDVVNGELVFVHMNVARLITNACEHENKKMATKRGLLHSANCAAAASSPESSAYPSIS